MTAPWEDPRVVSGLERLLAERRRLVSEGAKPIGWKVGFGAPSSLELMQITAPLLGYMTDATRLAPGTAVPTRGWQRGIVEFEVAVYLGRDLTGDVTEPEAAAAVSALGPAIELADIDLPLDPSAVPDIVAGGIFHKAVIFGEPDPTRAGLDIAGLEARIRVDGEERAVILELEAITGPYPWIVATVANTLAALGETLRAGDTIITGSVIPPIPVGEGSEFIFELSPLPPIAVVIE